MNTPPRNRRVSQGETRIRRAFIGSLATLVALGVLALSVVWLNHPPAPDPGVVEATINVSITPSDTPDTPATGHGTPAGPPALRFTDATEASGIDFVHVNGRVASG